MKISILLLLFINTVIGNVIQNKTITNTKDIRTYDTYSSESTMNFYSQENDDDNFFVVPFIIVIIVMLYYYCHNKLEHINNEDGDDDDVLPEYKETDITTYSPSTINNSNSESIDIVTSENNNYHLPTYEETMANSNNNN